MTKAQFLAWAKTKGCKVRKLETTVYGPRQEAYKEILTRDDWHAMLPEIPNNETVDCTMIRGMCNQLHLPLPDGIEQELKAYFRRFFD